MLGEDGESLSGLQVHMVGIKGTGMTALAELLHADGVHLTGSDVADTFFTEESLRRRGIVFSEGFQATNLPKDADLVIHSAAYDAHTHPELVAAAHWGIPVLTYTRALGLYSRHFRSTGIAGVHGKTTTSAMVGVILKAMGHSFRLLTGSLVPDFGDSATLQLGGDVLIAETCEYRRHFLEFRPENILLTSVEEDHQDYFPDLESIQSAFREYLELLPPNGTLVYCHENANVVGLAKELSQKRPEVELIPYGPGAEGPYGLTAMSFFPGRSIFNLRRCSGDLSLQVPGRHNVVNASGAWALAETVYRKSTGTLPGPDKVASATRALAAFRSTKRRSEVVGSRAGVTVIDDYAHHPTAIQTTLEGFRDFYRGRRLVVSFMSHTYSRTRALLKELASSFGSADILLLHRIYASARETQTGGVSGRVLFEETRKRHPGVLYYEEPTDALGYLQRELVPGDVLVTMGAGDNWKLGKAYLEGLA